jgi:hypothetical protein
MSEVRLLFRVDVGHDPDRGYAASVIDVPNNRMKGIRGNSIEQLVSRLRNVILEEARKKKDFPLEHEAGVQRSIIVPEDKDPLFSGGF